MLIGFARVLCRLIYNSKEYRCTDSSMPSIQVSLIEKANLSIMTFQSEACRHETMYIGCSYCFSYIQ